MPSPVNSRHNRVSGFVRESVRIETALGRPEIEKKIVA